MAKSKKVDLKKIKKIVKENKLIYLIPIILIIIIGIFITTRKIIKPNPDAYIETDAPDLFDFDTNYKDRKVVVAYFSATGNTKVVAEKIAEVFTCDAVAIEPEVPYSETDLTSTDPSTRPMRESAYDPFNPPEEPEDDTEIVDENKVMSLPDIKKISFNRYDTIFLGYPIWYGDAPRVIYTFISQTNLKGKVIIPFCTSDNDDISPSDNNLALFAPEDVNFMSGHRFTKDSTEDEIKDFVTNIGVDVNAFD